MCEDYAERVNSIMIINVNPSKYECDVSVRTIEHVVKKSIKEAIKRDLEDVRYVVFNKPRINLFTDDAYSKAQPISFEVSKNSDKFWRLIEDNEKLENILHRIYDQRYELPCIDSVLEFAKKYHELDWKNRSTEEFTFEMQRVEG